MNVMFPCKSRIYKYLSHDTTHDSDMTLMTLMTLMTVGVMTLT